MEITPEFLEKVRGNKRIRQRLAFEHPLWFALLYLRHHFKHPLAPFHIEMFHLIQNPAYELIAVMAFRESGKSTILNLTTALWSILGKPRKRFVIVIGKTQEQAKSHFTNIKTELLNNELLREDFGPFAEDEKKEWNKLSLELEYHGSKILSVAHEQSIRGLKYEQFRPDLIICDDLEDTSSTFSRTNSISLYKRFEREIVPVGSAGTRIIILGNLLSEYSFMMQLKQSIDSESHAGIFRAYPLLDDRGKCLWLGKFPDESSLKRTRAKLSQEAWAREYLLTLDTPVHDYDDLNTDTDDQVIAKRYSRKLAVLSQRYKKHISDVRLQSALIQPMQEFEISAPSQESTDEPNPGDPRYQKYQKYKGEIDELADQFHEELRAAIRARIMRREDCK